MDHAQDYKCPDPEIEGWMGWNELQWLHDRAKEMNAIVEVGSWKGRSTHALLATGRPVIAVDHFKGSASQINDVHQWAKFNDLYQAFKQNVGRFQNLFVMKMESEKAAEFFKDKSVDMILIDGDHELEMFRKDMEAWFPKCRKLLCGHDLYFMDVGEVLRESELPYRYENPVESIWSIRL